MFPLRSYNRTYSVHYTRNIAIKCFIWGRGSCIAHDDDIATLLCCNSNQFWNDIDSKFLPGGMKYSLSFGSQTRNFGRILQNICKFFSTVSTGGEFYRGCWTISAYRNSENLVPFEKTQILNGHPTLTWNGLYYFIKTGHSRHYKCTTNLWNGNRCRHNDVIWHPTVKISTPQLSYWGRH